MLSVNLQAVNNLDNSSVDRLSRIPSISRLGIKAFLVAGCLAISLFVFNEYLVFGQGIVIGLFLLFLIGVGCGYGVEEINSKHLKRTLEILAMTILILGLIGIGVGWLLEGTMLMIDVSMIGYLVGGKLSFNYIDE